MRYLPNEDTDDNLSMASTNGITMLTNIMPATNNDNNANT